MRYVEIQNIPQDKRPMKSELTLIPIGLGYDTLSQKSSGTWRGGQGETNRVGGDRRRRRKRKRRRRRRKWRRKKEVETRAVKPWELRKLQTPCESSGQGELTYTRTVDTFLRP